MGGCTEYDVKFKGMILPPRHEIICTVQLSLWHLLRPRRRRRVNRRILFYHKFYYFAINGISTRFLLRGLFFFLQVAKPPLLDASHTPLPITSTPKIPINPPPLRSRCVLLSPDRAAKSFFCTHLLWCYTNRSVTIFFHPSFFFFFFDFSQVDSGTFSFAEARFPYFLRAFNFGATIKRTFTSKGSKKKG